jgi:DNA-binding CsgD family transcriptional regulator
MNQIKRVIKNNITFTNSEAIKQLCEPLTLLGIHYFSYVHINANNEMAVLCNSPEFLSHYIKEGYYQFDLHRLSFNQKMKLVIWDHFERKNTTMLMHNDFRDYGFGHTCTIILEDATGRHHFNFATHYGKEHINQVYIEHQDKLERFIYYFRDQMSRKKSLQKVFDTPLFLNNAIGTFETIHELQNNSFDAFIEQTSFDRLVVNQQSYLTKAEMLCLYWMSKGKTLEETAIILNLSPRTVTAHVHSAKTKLNCTSLFQLGMYLGTLMPFNIEELIS